MHMDERAERKQFRETIEKGAVKSEGEYDRTEMGPQTNKTNER